MVLTPSVMVPLDAKAPDFALPDTTGAMVRRRDFDGSPLLVAFWCNHCPYVRHIADRFAEVAEELQRDHEIAVVAINSNDADAFPDDSPEAMVAEVDRRGYTFPYLFDGDQSVARAFQAACTPDLFLYDSEHHLVYRGQFDGSRPGNDVPVTGEDLLAAAEALLDGTTLATQVPSMGCNIKWRK